MTDANRILVTGGSGKTGSRIARRLAELGYAVRMAGRGSHPPGDAAAEHVPFDWYHASTHENALRGVSALYLVAPLSDMNPGRAMLPFVERAVQSGARRIVLLSSASVPEDGPVFGEVHRAIRELTPEWAVLQPSYFMQNFTEGAHGDAIRSRGTIFTATGEGRVGFVDADDIAEVGVRALVDREPHNAAHVITGPESLTYAEAAAIIGSITRRAVRHESIPVQELQAALVRAGLPGDYAGFLAGLDEAISSRGTEDQVTDTVERVTGRPPRSLAEFISAHAAAFSPGQTK